MYVGGGGSFRDRNFESLVTHSDTFV